MTKQLLGETIRGGPCARVLGIFGVLPRREEGLPFGLRPRTLYVKMHHSKSNMKLDVERYWPSELGYTRQGERKADVFYNVELGIARSFKLGRHWITPGVGVAWVHSVTWLPSHEEILGVTIVDGQYVPVAVITDYPFYRGDNLLGFCGQVDYTFHFRSGFFIGLRGHMWYTSWVEGITLSPVIGVRF